jgi:peptide methionine sulfoxide reductase msrA/msrB
MTKPPPLTPEEKRVIEDKSTETPFTGKYDAHFQPGTYSCRKCATPLYKSDDKFDAHCGWPAFDQEIPGRVTRTPDPRWYGMYDEITCTTCGAHLGHVFEGEGLTDTNTRHCVNSISLVFTPKKNQ